MTKFKPKHFARLFSQFRERLWNMGFRRFQDNYTIRTDDDRISFLGAPIQCLGSEIYADYYLSPRQTLFSPIVWTTGKLNSRGILFEVGVGATLLPLNEILDKLGSQHGMGSLVFFGSDLESLARRANDDYRYLCLGPEDDYAKVIDDFFERIEKYGLPLASESVLYTLQEVINDGIDKKKSLACLLYLQQFDKAKSFLEQLVGDRESYIDALLKPLAPKSFEEIESEMVQHNLIVSRDFIEKVHKICKARNLAALS